MSEASSPAAGPRPTDGAGDPARPGRADHRALMLPATLIALPGIPDVRPGMSLPDLLVRALNAAEIRPSAGDVLVVAQKVVSKAEGNVVDLAEVSPRAEARRLAGETGKDPRLVEVILRESTQVVRVHAEVLITEHRLGVIFADAGVDPSNRGVRPGGRLLVARGPERV